MTRAIVANHLSLVFLIKYLGEGELIISYWNLFRFRLGTCHFAWVDCVVHVCVRIQVEESSFVFYFFSFRRDNLSGRQNWILFLDPIYSVLSQGSYISDKVGLSPLPFLMAKGVVLLNSFLFSYSHQVGWVNRMHAYWRTDIHPRLFLTRDRLGISNWVWYL